MSDLRSTLHEDEKEELKEKNEWFTLYSWWRWRRTTSRKEWVIYVVILMKIKKKNLMKRMIDLGSTLDGVEKEVLEEKNEWFA